MFFSPRKHIWLYQKLSGVIGGGGDGVDRSSLSGDCLDPVCDKCFTTSTQSQPRGLSPFPSTRSHCFLFCALLKCSFFIGFLEIDSSSCQINEQVYNILKCHINHDHAYIKYTSLLHHHNQSLTMLTYYCKR